MQCERMRAISERLRYLLFVTNHTTTPSTAWPLLRQRRGILGCDRKKQVRYRRTRYFIVIANEVKQSNKVPAGQ